MLEMPLHHPAKALYGIHRYTQPSMQPWTDLKPSSLDPGSANIDIMAVLD